jgi:ribonuclease G
VSNELVIDVTASEIVIALLENKQLVELNKEKSNLQFSVGDIYLGKVKKLMPGLNAAFIDVGYEKDAFLHYLDLGPQFQTLQKFLKTTATKKGKPLSIERFKREPDIDKNGKISDVLASGQQILVQIAKEPISTKGPRLSSEISIAGRNLVLIPFSDKVSVSQKIKNSDEKARLKKVITAIKPKGYGVIVRTVAEGRKIIELESELKGLVEKWEIAFENIKGAVPPKIFISELNRTSAILRDMLNGTFSNIHMNNETLYTEVRDYIATIAPDKAKIVKHYNGNTPIFEKFGIDKQIKTLFGKTVSFKNGAYLIIDHTEALHVIDVNSGNRSKNVNDQETNALDVNTSACLEIARQLRLRDMGGIIVVDFIDMHGQEHKQQVFEKMKEFMSADRAKHNILPLSKFGLMQITRQRVRPELTVQTYEKCPVCKGSGEIAPSIVFEDELFNNISYLIINQGLRYITLKVHPFVASYLKKGLFSKRWKWILKLRSYIKIESIPSYTFLEYHFFYRDGEEILE